MKQRSLFLGLVAGLGALVSCQSGAKHEFVAEGNVSQAAGQMLYLEEVGTGNVFALDSIKLTEAGDFRFTRSGMNYPMFYRLRLGSSSIPFAADSLTYIKLQTSAANFFEGYKLIEADQYNYQIRDISLQRHRTDGQVDSLLGLYTSGYLGLEEVRHAVDSVVQIFKHDMTTRYIYVDPRSPAAYYALFQRKGGEAAYFSADEVGDDKAFAAVATAYDTYYSAAPYTPFLKNIALRAIAHNRLRQAQEQVALDTLKTPVRTITFPEIKLRDRLGQEQSLEAYAARGTVLLSFTAYSAQWSPGLVATLRKLSEQHPELTIYEVSADSDTYYWENAARTLPWVSVNDADRRSLLLYNVQRLPAFYLIRGKELKRIDHPEEAVR